MIAHLHGCVSEKELDSIIIDVHGLGFEVMLSAIDLEKVNLGDQLKLFTYHKVSEQNEELYGFSSLLSKRLFELLISVQGVGPKAAMSILGLAESEEIRNAIANTDAAFITRAAGIGKKTAERIIVDLRDKVGLPSRIGRAANSDLPGLTSAKDDALDALMALGYTLAEASASLADVDPNLDTAARVRAALQKQS